MTDEGMSYEEFINQPSEFRPENVGMAVRYLEWWFSIPHAIGYATEDAINTLMQFARDNDPTVPKEEEMPEPEPTDDGYLIHNKEAEYIAVKVTQEGSVSYIPLVTEDDLAEFVAEHESWEGSFYVYERYALQSRPFRIKEEKDA